VGESGFNASGSFTKPPIPQPVDGRAGENYIRRYLEAFAHGSLQGLRVGVYQHSAVGRDVLVTILAELGAEVTPLGRSDTFIPVDTEAIRPEDVELARQWGATDRFDAIVSADGDSDRPIVSDEGGEWLRGDVAGILCAKFLGADSVSTPVSCNTAVEKCGWFPSVQRTRIGSPYVVASMLEASSAGAKVVVGYEANGGFLLNSNVTLEGRALRALPTRDAMIVILSILLAAKKRGKKISELVAELPPRYTASDRLKDFPTADSQVILAGYSSGVEAADIAALGRDFGDLAGEVASINRVDGLRVTFRNGDVIHLRPSGNAPEFRCYTEASTNERALSLNAAVLGRLRGMVSGRK
jgi:phosphomannomutase